MNKYEPLPKFLSTRDTARVRLEFSAIQKILGFKLPRSAFEYEAWWSNNASGHSHARAWLSAGWRTEEVDVAGRQVTFVRTSATTSNEPKSDPFGCMAGTVTILPGTDIAAPSGETWNAERGVLHE